MLDNLRGMAVFASVVDCGSFSGAAKSLGITTSAVSQQVRALENDIGIVLLHRSTRKISLTEAGESFYLSCQDVVNAARNGRYRLSALRDELTGQLRVATTPELAENYLLPALDEWLNTHADLSLHIETENNSIDLIEERIDIALRVSDDLDQSRFNSYPLKTVTPILVATPEYLEKLKEIGRQIVTPDNLKDINFITVTTFGHKNEFTLTNEKTSANAQVKVTSRIDTNSVQIAKKLALQGKGILRVMDIDVQNELQSGDLVVVLPNWFEMGMHLYALALKRDQHPAKVTRCIDLLKNYFENLENISTLKTAS